MMLLASPAQWILGIILILASIGVLLSRKPVQASLSFLVTLLSLAALYLQLSASFISVMQILVYAGAILVVFVFVIVLFQDAHQQIARYEAKSKTSFLALAGVAFFLVLLFLAVRLLGFESSLKALPNDYGTVQSLGKLLYIDFFFPFEAIVMLFLIALVGALYIGKKEN